MAKADWKRICCPIDFSDASRAAMEVAADLARRFGAELVLLHAYPVPGYTFPDGSVVASPRMMQELADQAQKHLEEWRADAERLVGAPRVSRERAGGGPARARHARADRDRARAHGLHRGAGRAQGPLPGADRPAAAVSVPAERPRACPPAGRLL